MGGMHPGELLGRAWEHHKAGRLQQAEQLYQQVVQNAPRHAAALHGLGVIALQTGRYLIAVDHLRDAIAADPAQAHFHSNLAMAYRGLGRLPETEAALRDALQLGPGNPELHNNLGTVLLELKRPVEAEATWREVLRLNPKRAEAHNNLGTVLLELGRLQEARGCLQEAVRFKPDYAQAHNNLGLAYLAQGKSPEAEASWREAIRLNPGFPESHHNLGVALLEQGRPAEAEGPIREALRLRPGYIEALVNLGGVLVELDRPAEADVSLRAALRLRPDNAKAHNNLGGAYRALGKLAEAEAALREALRLKPDYARAHDNLGAVLLENGQLDRAELQFREALRQEPDHAGAHAHLATLLRGRLPDTDRAALERVLAEWKAGDAARLELLFGLAHVCDARGEYEAAAVHLCQANALALAASHRRGQGYDPAEHARVVDDLIAVFSSELFARSRGWGVDAELPVFIVGLPRSGTTLLEQILALHPQVHGAGELPLADEALDSLLTVRGSQEQWRACIAGRDGGRVQQLAGTYLERLRELGGGAVRVVDKMPDNYLYLGLIALLFPRAKLIHCRRDLRDTAVSCWITNFTRVRWANDTGHIAARFADYQRITGHWRAVLPVPLLEIDYEETVADLEKVARRLVAWCGLEWDPACLAFHRTARPIRTASATQVRQPIYRHAVGRWKHYEQELASLFAQLPQS